MDNQGDVLSHLERYLGKMVSGYIISANSPSVFQIAKFSHQPIASATTFTTLGLSKASLQQPDGSLIRQELLFSLYDGSLSDEVAKLLAVIADELLRSKKALTRGQVLGPSGPLLSSSGKEALYVTYPIYFPEEFHTFKNFSLQTFIAWLVPITAQEAADVKTFGWASFEHLLESKDPDLLDIHRSSLV